MAGGMREVNATSVLCQSPFLLLDFKEVQKINQTSRVNLRHLRLRLEDEPQDVRLGPAADGQGCPDVVAFRKFRPVWDVCGELFKG